MQKAPTEYQELWKQVNSAIYPERKPILIGFDGASCSGKSSAAAWLAWQFGMPSLHFDLFRRNPGDLQGPIQWNVADLQRCITSRGNRCLIVESVLLLDVMRKLGRAINYLVFVENAALESSDDDREFAVCNQVKRYIEREEPKEKADFVLSWTSG